MLRLRSEIEVGITVAPGGFRHLTVLVCPAPHSCNVHELLVAHEQLGLVNLHQDKRFLANATIGIVSPDTDKFHVLFFGGHKPASTKLAYPYAIVVAVIDPISGQVRFVEFHSQIIRNSSGLGIEGRYRKIVKVLLRHLFDGLGKNNRILVDLVLIVSPPILAHEGGAVEGWSNGSDLNRIDWSVLEDFDGIDGLLFRALRHCQPPCSYPE